MNYIVLDIEFGSSEEQTIAQFGAYKWSNGSIVDKLNIFTTNSDKNNELKISVKEAIAKIKNFIGDMPLVAHNGNKVDFVILKEHFSQQGWSLSNKLIDTLEIAHNQLNLENAKLEDLAKHFHISVDESKRHDALYDAEILGQCYLKMLTKW